MVIKTFKNNKVLLLSLLALLLLLGGLGIYLSRNVPEEQAENNASVAATPTVDEIVPVSPVSPISSASQDVSPVASPTPVPSPQATYQIELNPVATLAGEVDLAGKKLYYIIMPVYGPLTLTGLTADNQHIWVANNESNSILSLDPKTGEIEKTYPFPQELGIDPNVLGLTWDGENFWLAEATSKTIHQYDPTFQEQLATVTIDTHPGDLAWDGESLWVVNREDSELQNWSVDGEFLKSYTVPSTWITGLTWGADRLWYSDAKEKVVKSWDPATSSAKVVIVDALAEQSYGGLGWQGESLLMLDDLGGRLLIFDVHEFNFVK